MRLLAWDAAGEFVLDSKSVPRAVASVALAKDLRRKSRSLPLAVLIRQQYRKKPHSKLSWFLRTGEQILNSTRAGSV